MSSKNDNSKKTVKYGLMAFGCIIGMIASIFGMTAMSQMVAERAPKEPVQETFVNNHEKVEMMDLFASDDVVQEETEPETEANQMFQGMFGEEIAPSEEAETEEETEANEMFDQLLSVISEHADGAYSEGLSQEVITRLGLLKEKWEPKLVVSAALFNAHTIHMEQVKTIGEAAAFYAEEKLGMPYSQALRNSGTAYDCSSLVYWAYQEAGYDISAGGANTAAVMAQHFQATGRELTQGALMAGDLIFYSYEANENFMGIDHVCIVVGDGDMISASSGEGMVIRRKISLKNAVMVVRPCAEGGLVSSEVYANIQSLLSEPMIATASELTEEVPDETETAGEVTAPDMAEVPGESANTQ